MLYESGWRKSYRVKFVFFGCWSRYGYLHISVLLALKCSVTYFNHLFPRPPPIALMYLNSCLMAPRYWKHEITRFASSRQLCALLCSVMSDCNLPGFSVLGVSQAGIVGWVAISSSRGSFSPRAGSEPLSPTFPALAGGFFTAEPPGKPLCTITRGCYEC